MGYFGQMERTYLLQHERPDTDDVKVIGVYSSMASAQAAIERFREQAGFRNYPNCFTIDAYELDKDHWVEGFGDQ